jgi:hypothetical protein
MSRQSAAPLLEETNNILQVRDIQSETILEASQMLLSLQALACCDETSDEPPSVRG